MNTTTSTKPRIERLRFDSVRRNLVVVRIETVTPRMLRITLGGDELAGFQSPSPDDHIKVFFPSPDGQPQGRDYTPRSFDKSGQLLSIDFALHKSGPASTWARNAQPGDTLQIGGPRGSTIVSAPNAWWLLIGDETALPSIGRRLEEMVAGTRAFAVIAVTSREEEQSFNTTAKCEIVWVHRPDEQAGDPAAVLEALAKLTLPSGPGFIWIAGERELSRAARDYCINVIRHPVDWLKASAYWSMQQED